MASAGGEATGARYTEGAAEEGFVLHARRDDLQQQLAVFFSAPPHDVLSSRFTFHLVESPAPPSSGLPVPQTNPIPCIPNRVHFIPLQGGGGTAQISRVEQKVCDGPSPVSLRGVGTHCAKETHWIQLAVQRGNRSPRVVAHAYAGPQVQAEMPERAQKSCRTQHCAVLECPRTCELDTACKNGEKEDLLSSSVVKAAGGRTSHSEVLQAKKRRSLKELRTFAVRHSKRTVEEEAGPLFSSHWLLQAVKAWQMCAVQERRRREAMHKSPGAKCMAAHEAATICTPPTQKRCSAKSRGLAPHDGITLGHAGPMSPRRSKTCFDSIGASLAETSAIGDNPGVQESVEIVGVCAEEGSVASSNTSLPSKQGAQECREGEARDASIELEHDDRKRQGEEEPLHQMDSALLSNTVPPPPPAPPPPNDHWFAINGDGDTESKERKLLRSAPLRRLHWNVISSNVARETIWQSEPMRKAAGILESSIQEDIQGLQLLFAESSHKDAKRTYRHSRSLSEAQLRGMSHIGGITTASVQAGPPMVERKRAHAIEIMLSRFGKSNAKSLEAIAAAVKSLDYGMLSIDDVCALRQYQLTPDEKDLFRQYIVASDAEEDCEKEKIRGDEEILCENIRAEAEGHEGSSGVKREKGISDNKNRFDTKRIDLLGKAERYLVLMARVPQVEERMQLMQSAITLEGRINELRASLKIVSEACTQLPQNEALVLALALVRHCGNLMNESTSASPLGRACGFKLDALDRLPSIKTPQSAGGQGTGERTSLLDYIAKRLHELMPDSLDKLMKLDTLMRAERIDINDVRQHVDAVQSEMAQVLSLCNFPEAHGDVESLPSDKRDSASKCSRAADSVSQCPRAAYGLEVVPNTSESDEDVAADQSTGGCRDEEKRCDEGSLVTEARRLNASLRRQVRELLASLDETSQHLRVVCRQVNESEYAEE